jgi:hypothetical protein
MVMGVSGVSVDFGFSILTFGCGAAQSVLGQRYEKLAPGYQG